MNSYKYSRNPVKVQYPIFLLERVQTGVLGVCCGYTKKKEERKDSARFLGGHRHLQN